MDARVALPLSAQGPPSMMLMARGRTVSYMPNQTLTGEWQVLLAGSPPKGAGGCDSLIAGGLPTEAPLRLITPDRLQT